MEPRRVEVPPHSFWVRETGAGQPLILLHGLAGSSEWWKRNLDALAAHYRVFTVDLIGFGRNRPFARPSPLPLQFAEIASLLARWMESALREPAHVVGHSMGGHIAIHLAALRPDLIRSLTLVNATGVPFRVAPVEHIRNLFLPRGLFGFLTVLAGDAFRAGPTSIALGFGRLIRDDARPLLRALTMPVLLLWGEHDPLVPVIYAKAMLREIPNARLEIVPQASHIPMWENAEAFNHSLLTFLSNISDDERGQARSLFAWPIRGWHEGIAHREAGRWRDVVLLHGLGMSSAYFARFARALFDRGWSPVAPDLRGFGESSDGPPASPNDHAIQLAAWADAIGIRNAVWVGHSIGCNVVAHLSTARPDLVRKVICIGALWSPRSVARLLVELLADAFREPLAIYPLVVTAYWRAGLGRWFATLGRYASDLRAPRPPNVICITGRSDPIPDRKALGDLIDVPGAHACHFSHPEETAEAVLALKIK